MKLVVSQVQCPKCHKIFLNSEETFCPECGTRLPQAVTVAAPSAESVVPHVVPTFVSTKTVETASFPARLGAFVIDVLIAGLLTPLLLAPVVGQFFAGLIWGLYFLLRDMNGASIGKMVCGLKVVAHDGSSASTRQKIMRNVLLVLPDLAEWIPFLGIFLAPGVFLIILAVEAVVLLAKGERIGDMIANTLVVKRSNHE